ncbi:DUF1129 family protein [Lederbergia panacisoli]|uniref:DUF1129 family protein n=1 Tax=Lederbergia panacisoli TaxID=1255251 RepID=UPI00214B8A46|nr:DUF1129 family protein [Lederbergia panacisoli]MCR2821480.1 DUF1129 family protein [Lederbergia panacisoli]
MLSAKSERFIESLRLYLVTSGKNQSEINDLIEELKDHLIESEKHGRNIEDIIEGTPAEYMASLKSEMKTDYKSLVKNLPIFFLGLIAYLTMGTAIRGEFEINIVQVIGFPVVSVVSLVIYIVFLQRAGQSQYSNKKLFLVGMLASGSVMVLFILLMVFSGIFIDPFYKGSTLVNWIIVAICSFIFVFSALWSKAWFPIWIPAILFIPDFLSRFSNIKETTILVISFVSFILLFILIILSILVTERKKPKAT